MSSAPETRPARKEGTAISRAMRPLNHVVERFIPSALVFSIVLTFIVAILGLLLTPTGPADLIVAWGDGLAGLLAFMTQMALILLLGHMLANTAPVRKLLAFLASIPRTELAAYVFVFVVAAAVTILVVALALFLVAPRRGDAVKELEIDAREAAEDGQEEVVTPADRLDASRFVTGLIGLALVAYLVLHFSRGGTLTLDTVNWSFLALILLLVKNPFELIHLTKNAASNVGEILLQFPLYAGILGMMVGSGLVQVFSDAFVSISTTSTFGLFAFLAAGLVNFFVPSGGGQFAVQGPIMLNAGAELGVDPSITIMAVSYGDQWTNMIQPFWALPLLAIAGLKMRDILGYTTIVLIASGLVFAGTLLIVSL